MQNKDIKVEYSWRYVEGKPELIIQKRYNNGSDEAKDVTTLKLIDHAALTAKWPHIGANNPKVVIDLSCKLKNCELCQNGSKIMLRYGIKKNHGWKQRLVLAFSIIKASEGKAWISLNKDVYPFFETHWSLLWPQTPMEKYASWRKKLQDSLSHNKDIFESGTSEFSGKKGFWRLNEPALAAQDSENRDSGSDSEHSPPQEIKSKQNKPTDAEQLHTNAIAEIIAALRKGAAAPGHESPNSSPKRKANEGIEFVLGDMLRSGEFDTSDSRFTFVPKKKQMSEQHFLQRDIAAK